VHRNAADTTRMRIRLVGLAFARWARRCGVHATATQPGKKFNPSVASGAIGMYIDDFNGDNFDHGPHGFALTIFSLDTVSGRLAFRDALDRVAPGMAAKQALYGPLRADTALVVFNSSGTPRISALTHRLFPSRAGELWIRSTFSYDHSCGAPSQ
jgi:hypothetical protein